MDPRGRSPRSTFSVKCFTGSSPGACVDTTPSGELTQACGLLVTEPVAGTGLCTALWAEWGPQRKPLAAHDPGKVIPDLAANGPAALNAINTTRAVARARAWVTA